MTHDGFTIDQLVEQACDADRELNLRRMYKPHFAVSVVRQYVKVHHDGRVWFGDDLRRGRDRA
jgi:hypothetical protein